MGRLKANRKYAIEMIQELCLVTNNLQMEGKFYFFAKFEKHERSWLRLGNVANKEREKALVKLSQNWLPY